MIDWVENNEFLAIESRKSIVRAKPYMSVRGLCNAENLSSWDTVFDVPFIYNVTAGKIKEGFRSSALRSYRPAD